MENKRGKYARRLQTNYCVLDTETTGLQPGSDAIIEIAILRIRKGEIDDTFTTLVNPEREIPPLVVGLTGITDRMVANAPTIEKVIDEAFEFIGSDLIVGHNTSFDLRFLAQHRSIENKYVDTMQFARKLYPELKHHRLSDLQQYLHLSTNNHRALADCKTTYELYETIKATMKEDGLTCEDLWPRTKEREFYKARARQRRAEQESEQESNVLATIEYIPPARVDNKNKKTLKKSMPMVFITVFFGWFGLHRFLSGQKLLGLIYFFTAGIFMFGWVIDSAIMIVWAIQNISSHFSGDKNPIYD